jgi:hypothetical protein
MIRQVKDQSFHFCIKSAIWGELVLILVISSRNMEILSLEPHVVEDYDGDYHHQHTQEQGGNDVFDVVVEEPKEHLFVFNN